MSTVLMCSCPHAVMCEEQGITFNPGESIITKQARDLAADVLLVVDESNSMEREHAWLPTMIAALEQKLINRGIGSGSKPNLYSLTGFGAGRQLPDQCPTEKLTQSGNRMFRASEYGVVNRQLTTEANGQREDGWHAVKFAMETTPWRRQPGVAHNIILVTDEDRDNDCDPTLTAQDVTRMLQRNNFVLNAVLDQHYTIDRLADVPTALGVSGGLSGSNKAFLKFTPGEYTTITDTNILLSSERPNYNLGTKVHYVDWTLDQGGAVWDLNFLRNDDIGVQNSFTEALADVKTGEILEQAQACFRCTCTVEGDTAVSECVPVPQNTPGCQ